MERGEELWRLAHAHANDFLRRFGDPWTQNHRDDLVQETAIAAWRWAGDLRDPHRLWAAVRTIARRVRCRALAAEFRRRTAQQRSGADVAEHVHDSHTLPESHLAIAGRRVSAHHALRFVHRAIGRLRPVDRQLLADHLEGFCCAELAARSSRSEQCVRTRLHRARRRVQSEVEACVRAADALDP